MGDWRKEEIMEMGYNLPGGSPGKLDHLDYEFWSSGQPPLDSVHIGNYLGGVRGGHITKPSLLYHYGLGDCAWNGQQGLYHDATFVANMTENREVLVFDSTM
jgi:hypothetical protein